MGESIVSYLGAVGIRLKMRPMERATYTAALQAKKLRGLCVCATAIYGNAASRIAEHRPERRAPTPMAAIADIDALYKEQALVTDRKKREALLHQIQQLAARARAVRADLGLHLAERRGPAGRRAGADADQSVSVVGAARRGAPQEEVNRAESAERPGRT